MKRLINYELISMIWVGLIFCTSLIGGCQKGEPSEEAMPISLNEIPENPKYGSLPLIGTEWKLVGFADERTSQVKLAKSHSDNSYTVIFEDKGTLRGHTSTNEAIGKYFQSEENLLSIAGFSNVTEINEIDDGPLFIEAMNNVNAFEIASKGLLLKYGQENFLLFKPVE